MKIRNGFVSNSSTSSFLIYGCSLDNDEIPGNDEDGDAYDIVELLIKDTILEMYSSDYSCGVYIGVSWDSIGDNQTGAEFKLEVETTLERIMGKPIKCTTLEEAWSDG